MTATWRSALVVLLMLPFAVGARAGGASAENVPAVIAGANSPYPQWVAADIGVAADGTLRHDLLGQFIPSLRRVAQWNAAWLAKEATAGTNAALPADECRVPYGPPADHIIRTQSVEDLTSRAGLIVEGEIVAGRQGFYGGLPGTLFLLNARYVKGAPLPSVLLFYPHARITTADGMICTNARGAGNPVPPQPGDRVLLFYLGEPRPEGGYAILRVSVDRELVHEIRGGATRVPHSLRGFADDPQPIDAILRGVAAAQETSIRKKGFSTSITTTMAGSMAAWPCA